MKVVVKGRTLRLASSKLIGQGGEAEVYAHGRREVVKIFKQPDHPDFAADAAQRTAAERRIEEHQHKLIDFPSGLPAAVVSPAELARDPASGRIVGYMMRRVAGEPLYALQNARVRRDRGLAAQTEVLVAIREAVVGLHSRNVVIGDFNDLNVLVSGIKPYLIDSDSYQFAGYACPVYSERFLDPQLVANGAFARPFSVDSDWYAFAVITVQTLLSVGPYGGVLQGRGSSPRVPHAQRPHAKLSIFNAPVRLPRPALPPAVLPDDLRGYFESVFAGDRRGVMARELLADLRWQRCSACGIDHARPRCPHCAPTARRAPMAAMVGTTIISDPARVAAIRAQLLPSGDVWIDGRRLLRRGALGPEYVGDVLAAATRFWTGETFGLGFYTAGRMRFGFVFDRRRRGINDQVALDAISGTLAAADCALSDRRAWLIVSEAIGPSIEQRITVVERNGERVAHTDVTGVSWASGLPGACAVGDVLLVPTDDGVVRVVTQGGAVAVDKTFTATSAVVDSATQLVSDGRSLYAVGRDEVFELSC